jgi:hypothetical protein
LHLKVSTNLQTWKKEEGSNIEFQEAKWNQDGDEKRHGKRAIGSYNPNLFFKRFWNLGFKDKQFRKLRSEYKRFRNLRSEDVFISEFRAWDMWCWSWRWVNKKCYVRGLTSENETSFVCWFGYFYVFRTKQRKMQAHNPFLFHVLVDLCPARVIFHFICVTPVSINFVLYVPN